MTSGGPCKNLALILPERSEKSSSEDPFRKWRSGNVDEYPGYSNFVKGKYLSEKFLQRGNRLKAL